ncbi:MAG: hypothetical protein QG627_822 [Chlamydiota bacterium]|jgi:hypothetical protein|nr:hypothetical protein [Chlamydiota bacterium]
MIGESDVKRIPKGACDILPLLEGLDKDIPNKFSKLNIILVDIYKNKRRHIHKYDFYE